MDDMEKERQEMYLVMFKKGREAAEHDVQEVLLSVVGFT